MHRAARYFGFIIPVVAIAATLPFPVGAEPWYRSYNNGTATLTEPVYHRYYDGEAQPLRMDTGRIAIEAATGKAADDVKDALARAGVPSDNLEKHPIGNWHLAGLPEGQKSEKAILAALKQLAADPAVAFVSPIFVNAQDGPEIITPDLYVAFEENAPAEDILARMGAGSIVERDWANMPDVYWTRPDTRSGLEMLMLANAIAGETGVRYAEPDMIIMGRGSFSPNDPFYKSGDAWQLQNVGQSGQYFNSSGGYSPNTPGVNDMDLDCPEAWDITQGHPSISILIIDTGVQQDHPDINQNPGRDFTDNPGVNGGPANQFDVHGTSVAGSATAIIHNNKGAVGIAPLCKSVSARCFITVDDTGAWTTRFNWTVNALTWAEEQGIGITNNSNFYSGSYGVIETKYEQTYANGMIHFASAGNDSANQVWWPASHPNVEGIGAINRKGERAFVSNFGTGIDFVAPGEFVYIPDRTGNDGYVAGDYAYGTGTSFASPIAAGVAALIRSLLPDASPADIKTIMKQSAMDLGSASYDTTFGWGLVNAQGAASIANAGRPTAETIGWYLY